MAARSLNTLRKNVKVMMIGLGQAGLKATEIAAKQFEHPHYAFVGIDKGNEVINLPDNNLDLVIALDEGWEQQLEGLLEKLEMVVLVLGLGGKTGFEAAKTIANYAATTKLPVIVMATTPFAFEAETRRAEAGKALNALQKIVNSVIVIPNETLFGLLPPETTFKAAFERADEWIAEASVALLRPFTMQNLLNIKLENLEWLIQKQNTTCSLGIGWGEGEDPVFDAITQLSQCPFLRQYAAVSQADAALVMVTFPEDTTTAHAKGCLDAIKKLFPHIKQLEIGACTDESIPEGIRIIALMRFPKRPRVANRIQPSLAFDSTGSGTNDSYQFDNAPPMVQPLEPTTQEADGQQLLLRFNDYSNVTGIFSPTAPTKHNFENLDVPTYLRQGVFIPTEP